MGWTYRQGNRGPGYYYDGGVNLPLEPVAVDLIPAADLTGCWSASHGCEWVKISAEDDNKLGTCCVCLPCATLFIPCCETHNRAPGTNTFIKEDQNAGLSSTVFSYFITRDAMYTSEGAAYFRGCWPMPLCPHLGCKSMDDVGQAVAKENPQSSYFYSSKFRGNIPGYIFAYTLAGVGYHRAIAGQDQLYGVPAEWRDTSGDSGPGYLCDCCMECCW